MNRKFIFPILIIYALTATIALGAKYTVNSSGVIKANGQTIASPGNIVNQNYYNNYYAQNYINSNIVNSGQISTIEIVMDFSGSMSNWINAAKKSISMIIAQIPQTTRVGLRVFGHDRQGNNPTSIQTLQDVKKIVKNGNKFTVVTEKGPIGITKGACSATAQVTPITAANSISLLNGMNSVSLGGATPLVYALDRAVYQDFGGLDTISPKKIILVTDGGENCGGDPCAFAKKLVNNRNDVHIDVILASSNSRKLTCLSSTTGGHFYTVNNLSDFSTTMTQSMQSQPQEPDKNYSQKYEFIGE